MKPSLQLKLSQHLALTPQLQQSIKLLQLSTIELNQEIEKVLLENPMLERDEPESQLGSSRVEAPGPLAPAGSEAAQEREQEQARESDQRERDTDREFDFAEGGDWQGSGSQSRPRYLRNKGDSCQSQASERSRTDSNSSPGMTLDSWQGMATPSGAMVRWMAPQPFMQALGRPSK